MSWQKIKFGDFAEVQPQVVLTKGSDYPFIEMADVEPHTKFVHRSRKRIWKGGGGAKFENGDTIFARITPCLEHGKTAQISHLAGGRGFGSTEFFVFRAKRGISDPDFIYYLSRTPAIRLPAIKSMVGTSGRQRAQRATVENIVIRVPKIEEQRRIATILSAYDELIENNRRRIQLLEQAARLLYKEWFVHLRFPGYERAAIIDGVPKGWGKKTLGDVARITMGQSPKSAFYNKDENGLPFHQGVANFGNRFPSHKIYCTEENRLAESGDILFSVRAPVGRINIARDKIVIGRGIAAIRSNRNQQSLLFYTLKNHFHKEDMMGSGTIFTAVTKKEIHGVELMLAPNRIANMFAKYVRPIDYQIANLQLTIEKLTTARDFILPRLLNGKIPVRG